MGQRERERERSPQQRIRHTHTPARTPPHPPCPMETDREVRNEDGRRKRHMRRSGSDFECDKVTYGKDCAPAHASLCVRVVCAR